MNKVLKRPRNLKVLNLDSRFSPLSHNKQKKLLFDNEAEVAAGSPLDGDRAKRLQETRKKLPIGKKVRIEASSQRHPMEGKLVLIDDALGLGSKNHDPRFKIGENQFKLSEIDSWCLV